MPYEVLADTSIPKVIAIGTGGHEIRESIVHAAGDVIGDDAVAPEIKERLEDGDDRTSRLLRHVSQDEAADIQKKSGQTADLTGSIVSKETSPDVPNPVEIGKFENSDDSGSKAVAESHEDPSVEVEETPAEETKKDDSTGSSDEEKENKFAGAAKKKAPAKKAAPKKKAPKKKAPKR